MHQIRIELDDDEYKKLLTIASILKEKGYINSEDEVPDAAKILLKVAVSKFIKKFVREGLITPEFAEGKIKKKEEKRSIFIRKLEKSIKTRPTGYSSSLDRAIDKATEKGQRIFFSPFDDEYKQYLKEFRKKNLRYFD